MTFGREARPQSINKYLNRLSEVPVNGEFCSKWFLFVPLTSGLSIDRAWENAMNQVNGTEALIDVTVESKTDFFSGLYNVFCYRVIGKPVSFKETPT
jgi:hypothetical protein